jgi:hypothetical protein
VFACDRTAELKRTKLKDVDDRAAMTRELKAMEITAHNLPKIDLDHRLEVG